MKLQVLIGVCVCVHALPLQADEENRERPHRPFLEKRGENTPNSEERNAKMRHHPDGKGDMFGMLDKDKDGVITSEEFFAGPRMVNVPEDQKQKIFSRIDTDGDGRITAEEIRKMRQESQEKHMREIRELDTDKSGGLSYEEMSKGRFFSQLPEDKRKQIFARMDTNGDGQITPEDRPKGPHPHPEGREHPERFKGRERGAPDEAPSAIE